MFGFPAAIPLRWCWMKQANTRRHCVGWPSPKGCCASQRTWKKWSKIKRADAFRRQLLAAMTPETIQRWRTEVNTPKLPKKLALLGGHPRSGTTLLEQILDARRFSRWMNPKRLCKKSGIDWRRCKPRARWV